MRCRSAMIWLRPYGRGGFYCGIWCGGNCQRTSDGAGLYHPLQLLFALLALTPLFGLGFGLFRIGADLAHSSRQFGTTAADNRQLGFHLVDVAQRLTDFTLNLLLSEFIHLVPPPSPGRATCVSAQCGRSGCWGQTTRWHLRVATATEHGLFYRPGCSRNRRNLCLRGSQSLPEYRRERRR